MRARRRRRRAPSSSTCTTSPPPTATPGGSASASTTPACKFTGWSTRTARTTARAAGSSRWCRGGAPGTRSGSRWPWARRS
uniref:Uncharacterized protein n=1 Tax=Zea mays TaxID=4577 RepID=C4J5U6_MAIZE|nr:unknown [Zea mays]